MRYDYMRRYFFLGFGLLLFLNILLLRNIAFNHYETRIVFTRAEPQCLSITHQKRGPFEVKNSCGADISFFVMTPETPLPYLPDSFSYGNDERFFESWLNFYLTKYRPLFFTFSTPLLLKGTVGDRSFRVEGYMLSDMRYTLAFVNASILFLLFFLFLLHRHRVEK